MVTGCSTQMIVSQFVFDSHPGYISPLFISGRYVGVSGKWQARVNSAAVILGNPVFRPLSSGRDSIGARMSTCKDLASVFRFYNTGAASSVLEGPNAVGGLFGLRLQRRQPSMRSLTLTRATASFIGILVACWVATVYGSALTEQSPKGQFQIVIEPDHRLDS